MMYLDKKDVLKAYKVLSTISPDPTLQGATQKVSALRYALALDMFCHKQGTSECDTRDKEEKDLFVTYVGQICSVSSGLYTPNFYYPLKTDNGDFNVGSNFYSVGQVHVSLANPTRVLEYPKRGNTPLFRIKNGVLIRDVSLYSNLNSYLGNDRAKAAFDVWISRNIGLTPESSTYSTIRNALAQLMSPEMIAILMPETSNFIQETNKLITSQMGTSQANLQEEDINKLFHSLKGVSSCSNKYRQYITAIKSKPFLLLAGISGTGKSRIVRELARSCWDKDSEEYKAQKPRNFEMIQVKPNWHDSSELFGYVSRIKEERFVVGPFLKFMVKALKEPDVPYFLCLDEMNLAPVEQYFAEYLSVIESRKLTEDGSMETDPIVDFESTDAYHSLISQLFPEEKEEELKRLFLLKEGGKRLSIPPNLIVVGTVNMDETTFSFSRKVLDRAMTIEMNEVDLWGGLTDRHEPIEQQSSETLIGTAVEGVDVYTDYKEVCDTCLNYLQSVNEVLEGTPFKVAYRTRNEVLLYVVNNLPYNQSADGTTLPQEYVVARALDEITNMKILSRIEGDESKVRKDFLDSLVKTISEGLKSILDNQNGAESVVDNDSLIEKSVSLAKLKEMTKKLEDSGYTSYWS